MGLVHLLPYQRLLPRLAWHHRLAWHKPSLCCRCLQIGWQRGKEGGVLLAEPNLLGRDERERLCQLMFEVWLGFFV